jgi:hypothetical protein
MIAGSGQFLSMVAEVTCAGGHRMRGQGRYAPWTGLLVAMAAAGIVATIAWAAPARAMEWKSVFAQGTKVVSIEGAIAHFGARLPGNGIQSWNLGARISLIPFGDLAFARFHPIDGALEIGLEPFFQRFETQGQNFGGLLLEGRYYLTYLSYGPVVPWVGAAIGPGRSDLRLGTEPGAQDTLVGPFLATIQGEIGVSYFLSPSYAIYVGLQGEHFSNGSLNGGGKNAALNTPWAGVFGASWLF